MRVVALHGPEDAGRATGFGVVSAGRGAGGAAGAAGTKRRLPETADAKSKSSPSIAGGSSHGFPRDLRDSEYGKTSSFQKFELWH